MSDKYISIPHDSGVSSLSTTAGAELAELIGLKTVQKGIKVQFVDSSIVVDAIINVKYGENIVKVAQDVQNRVRALIVSTTGIEDAQINIHVSGISFEK